MKARKDSKAERAASGETGAGSKANGRSQRKSAAATRMSLADGANPSHGQTGEALRPLADALGSRTVPKRPRASSAVATEGRKGKPVLKLLNGFLTFFVVMLLAIGGGTYYMMANVDAEGPLKEQKLLVVPRNDSTQQIAERIEKSGMVADSRMFLAGLYALRIASLLPGGKTINLKAGEYEIKPGASIRSLIDTMSEGRSVLMRVTIPEGLTSYQIVERLKADQSLTGEIREVPAEGSLLPETYSLPRGSLRSSLIEMMQAAQKKLIDQLWNERQANLPVKSPAEAIILASVVEKETGRHDERDRVAAVFVNRLRKGMKLQSDPTILYGLALGKVQWGKPIYQSEIQSRTAHNTYVIPALPPTPICNPGRATLEATLKPAQTNELFFVADGKGGHIFAETNRQHELNVLKWRAIERERAGAAATAAPAAPAPAGGATLAPAQVTTINSTTSKAGASSATPAPKKQ